MKVELKGMEEMLKAVRELEDRGEALEKKALFEAGDIIKEAVSSEAPVTNRMIPERGLLKKSITRSGLKHEGGVSYVEIKPSGKAYYGKFVEFGTSKMAANPFMSRGYDKSVNKAMERAIQVFKKGLGL
jgi:HK97 gp10 family phage protein